MCSNAMDKDPFSLRDLPARHAPGGLWPSIAQRLDRPPRKRPPLAIAAAVLVAAVIVVVLEVTGPEPAAGPASADEALLAGARQASMQLEREISGGRTRVVGGADAAQLAWIEAELRLTDELLSERPSDVDLWLKRTGLLGEMARLYDGHDWQTQVRLASY
jgi:hypothetical protein